ncbi:uncharacterized protein LOC129618540 [Condylostylus longicornis]|uniref:uncharacterized protein LOC129618540 n=1 Tax=Condylostylus longicornis TaxID=2530218 RepID=UPI00244DE3F3|nr:uncharacterized protein LOC129618540 [Condylostylus longicornis]
MNLKFLLLLIFQIVLIKCEESNFDQALNIFKPSATIRLARPLKTGDVITVKGIFTDSGTEASFDLENDNCDWTYRHLNGCIEYDLFVQFHTSKMYRRINLNGEWKHHLDTYYLRPVKARDFKYTFKVKPDHFQADLFGYEMGPLNFTEPIESLSMFRVYGHAIRIENQRLNIDKEIIKRQRPN